MRPHPLVAVSALLVLIGGCAPLRPAPPAPVLEFVEALERARRELGCTQPLRWESHIAEVARQHTVEMRLSTRVRHVNSVGDDVGERLAQGGVRFLIAAENLAAGPQNGERAFQLWYDSPGHRANMLNCAYTHHAVIYDRGYWTHVLAVLADGRPWATSPAASS